eukprot:1148766-Pelagomonas_calceolata.AAC.11
MRCDSIHKLKIAAALVRAQHTLSGGKEKTVGPLNGTGAQGGDAVGQGVALASVAVTASEHNGLHGTIQLGQGHLCGITGDQGIRFMHVKKYLSKNETSNTGGCCLTFQQPGTSKES